jgi:hypothetical protein
VTAKTVDRPARSLSARTWLAIHAFHEIERVRFLLDRKVEALKQLPVPDEELGEYVRVTSEIEARYVVKRERAGVPL